MANSHKRDTDARKPRAVVVAGPLAALATAGAVTLGVVGADVEQAPVTSLLSAPAPTSTGSSVAGAGDVAGTLSRSSSLSRGSSGRADAQADEEEVEEPRSLSAVEKVMRPKAVAKRIKNADAELWTTAPLNLWLEPGKKADKTGEVSAGEKVTYTGRDMYGRQEIVWKKGETRWVTAGSLSEDEPLTLAGDCTNGTSVPSSVAENVKLVHAAVCANFPSITTYGTWRVGDGGDHGTGHAVDVMVSGELGWQIANFLRDNYADLGIKYLIYSQQIWSLERGGEGWRGMSDRGGATANHYDHVHVSTF
ncbi:MAG: hypothetical protein CMH83_21685 [Nocardioides sp.]|nr:hypothetical protein [Nocardioides sp.]